MFKIVYQKIIYSNQNRCEQRTTRTKKRTQTTSGTSTLGSCSQDWREFNRTGACGVTSRKAKHTSSSCRIVAGISPAIILSKIVAGCPSGVAAAPAAGTVFSFATALAAAAAWAFCTSFDDDMRRVVVVVAVREGLETWENGGTAATAAAKVVVMVVVPGGGRLVVVENGTKARTVTVAVVVGLEKKTAAVAVAVVRIVWKRIGRRVVAVVVLLLSIPRPTNLCVRYIRHYYF